ncbi:hypothetical protein AVEN_103076-1 [Araneus ventricosus]|uniref:Uncharacterized protein n=1 Tax=Araneus ventricosus TaxID=182803 RepID=A0A4Y2B8T4_ARAVE|nr:hypothetical protein AVEN_103076-1 [Araneus ventricosus]
MEMTSQMEWPPLSSDITPLGFFYWSNIKKSVFATRNIETLKATRGLFWNRPRNFEPWSDDDEAPEPASLSPNFSASSEGGHLTPTDLGCTKAANTAFLQRNWVSNPRD